MPSFIFSQSSRSAVAPIDLSLKKKRRIFFWLPLLSLALGGAITAAIWLTNNNENHIAQTKEGINKIQSNLPSVQNKPAEKKQSPQDIPEKTIGHEKNNLLLKLSSSFSAVACFSSNKAFSAITFLCFSISRLLLWRLLFLSSILNW